MNINPRIAGFTLVEVLVASTISVFIALVAAGAMRTMTASSDAVDENINAAAEVRFAAGMIERDLGNFYHNDDIQNTKFIATLEQLTGDISASYLVFYTVSRIKARADQPEDDIYEVEYYLTQEEEKSMLMRRVWPNPSKDLEPGGMLTVIAEDIELFEVQYYDGEQWVYEWPEEMQSVPQLVMVTLTAKPPGSGAGTGPMESFIVALSRSQGGDITALGTTTGTTQTDTSQTGTTGTTGTTE